MRNLGLGFNEIMICILAVVFYGFMVTMEELDKDYNKFSEEDREEAKGIIEKSLEGKIGKGIFISGILALGICFYIKSGSTSLRSLVDTVFIDQLLSMTKYVIRFFYFLSLFFGILLFYLLIILYRIKLPNSKISFLAKNEYLKSYVFLCLKSLILGFGTPILMKMVSQFII